MAFQQNLLSKWFIQTEYFAFMILRPNAILRQKRIFHGRIWTNESTRPAQIFKKSLTHCHWRIVFNNCSIDLLDRFALNYPSLVQMHIDAREDFQFLTLLEPRIFGITCIQSWWSIWISWPGRGKRLFDHILESLDRNRVAVGKSIHDQTA